MIVPQHYSLNIVYDGNHWARVNFELDGEVDAKRKARQIAEALRATYGQPTKWSFALVNVETVMRAVEGLQSIS